ncbi:MAG: hypothetical protein R8F63_10405 [Acidimicrobiales bacterium]|nr:hypothetical protein [Acidimicrobiales bacterium]
MTTTTTTSTEPDKGSAWLGRSRTAGIAGLVWGALLIITNIITGSVQPGADADVAEVAEHLVDDRGPVILATLGFVIAIPFVIVFVVGLARRIHRDGQTAMAVLGLFAFSGVAAMFAMTAATRLTLVVALETQAIGPDPVWTIWKLHEVVFGFNAAFLAAAYLAFALGAVAIGLVPRFFGVVAPIGAALLMISAVLTPQAVEGEMYPMAFGGLGFLTWVVFVITVSYRLSREEG